MDEDVVIRALMNTICTHCDKKETCRLDNFKQLAECAKHVRLIQTKYAMKYNGPVIITLYANNLDDAIQGVTDAMGECKITKIGRGAKIMMPIPYNQYARYDLFEYDDL